MSQGIGQEGEEEDVRDPTAEDQLQYYQMAK
jgi:hypothetical protein